MKRLSLLLGALVLVAAGAAAAFLLYKKEQSADVRGSSTIEFVLTDIPQPQTQPQPRPRPVRPKPVVVGIGAGVGRPLAARAELGTVYWPTFGYDNRRLRSLASDLRPPFRAIWGFRARSLVEFPPAVAYGRLYFASNSGSFFAINARTGKRAWRYDSGRCVASSPAVDDHVVFQTFLNRPPCNSGREDLDGEVVAFAAGFGKIRWRTAIGPSESSPLVADGRVYVGDWRGKVYALDERTGKVRWTFQTGGKVKGALALAGGRVFAGSYDSHLYALDARTGKEVWRASTQDRLGGRGTFYSTPAVAYDRVYIGSTDGKVYSFGATTGKLRWSQGTGGYVYGSPAIWGTRVFIGSYSGTFYALDAATGEEVWRFRANGPISGSATVLGNVVYFATLKRMTYALDAATGKPLWTWPDGKYTPAVTDGRRLYLVGYARVYGMVEK